MALVKPQVTQESSTATEAVVEKETLTQAGVESTAKVQPTAEVVQTAEVVSSEPLTTEGVAATVQDDTAQETVGTAVAVAEPAGAVSVAAQRTNAMAQFTQDQAAAGFEGLELTGMSFDRIKMHEGKFLLGSDETELGTDFQCVIHSTRRLFVVRQSTDNDAEAFYSYDSEGKSFTDGSSAAEKLEEWADEGYGGEENPLDIKEYLEAMVTLVNRDDEFDGQMAMLSIPPASKARLAGVAAQAYTKLRGAKLNDVVTQCVVGKKVGEGTKAFRPWVFKALTRYEG
jgi:hypothetical protein